MSRRIGAGVLEMACMSTRCTCIGMHQMHSVRTASSIVKQMFIRRWRREKRSESRKKRHERAVWQDCVDCAHCAHVVLNTLQGWSTIKEATAWIHLSDFGVIYFIRRRLPKFDTIYWRLNNYTVVTVCSDAHVTFTTTSTRARVLKGGTPQKALHSPFWKFNFNLPAGFW